MPPGNRLSTDSHVPTNWNRYDVNYFQRNYRSRSTESIGRRSNTNARHLWHWLTFRKPIFKTSIEGKPIWAVPFPGSDKSVVQRTQYFNHTVLKKKPVGKGLTGGTNCTRAGLDSLSTIPANAIVVFGCSTDVFRFGFLAVHQIQIRNSSFIESKSMVEHHRWWECLSRLVPEGVLCWSCHRRRTVACSSKSNDSEHWAKVRLISTF